MNRRRTDTLHKPIDLRLPLILLALVVFIALWVYAPAVAAIVYGGSAAIILPMMAHATRG